MDRQDLIKALAVYLTTNIIGCPVESVDIGDRVRVKFEQHSDVWLPLFEGSADGGTLQRKYDELNSQFTRSEARAEKLPASRDARSAASSASRWPRMGSGTVT